MRLKIRKKIILSFFVPIIPLTVIVVIVSGYVLNNLYNKTQKLESMSKENAKVADLRLSLDMVLMPANDYIITENKKYADDFKVVSMEIENRFKEMEDIARTSEEKEILKDVKGAWKNIKEISPKIFAIPDPVDNKDAMRLMEEMDYKWGYPAIERLKRWKEIEFEEYRDYYRIWRQAWFTMIVSVISFLVICFVYILIYSRIAARDEEELRKSEHKYRTLLENLEQKIFYKDRNSIYIACNENYARDLKITPDEIAGRTDYEFFPKELAEKYRADDKRLMEIGKTEDIEEKYIQDGQELWVHTVKTPVRDDSGRVIGILGIFWDITEKKKAEEKIKQHVDELERFQKATVQREFRIKELKDEIQGLKLKIKELRNE